MNRLAIAFAALAALGLLAASTIHLDRDARGLLGDATYETAALDSAEGRALTVAIISPDRDRRSNLAREIAKSLKNDPMIARVSTGPALPSAELSEWFWSARFLIAPPGASDTTVGAMAHALRSAREELLDIAMAPLASRFLLDPTGSFKRLISSFVGAGSDALPRHDGVVQARDDSAALIFIELTNETFEVTKQAAFDRRLRSEIETNGAEALLIGPRSLSARISEDIATRSVWVALIGSGLILAWIMISIGPAQLAPLVLVPVALGGLAAVLAVQLLFGAVHVVALGFGGALIGLAIDYPFHLLGHNESAQARHNAKRKIGIGAATTAIGFLALTGSGLPVIMQVGVFVAVGLTISAAISIWLLAGIGAGRLRGRARAPKPFSLKWRSWGLAALFVVALLYLTLTPGRDVARLIALPGAVTQDIARLDAMIDLPSGRYAYDVSAERLDILIIRLRELDAKLAHLIEDDIISKHASINALLPPGTNEVTLPTPEALRGSVEKALVKAGLRPGYSDQIVEAYRSAAKPDDPNSAILPFLPETGSLLTRLIRQEPGGFVAPVQLWDVADTSLLRAIAEQIDGARFVDRQGSLSTALQRTSDRVWLCLSGGGIAASIALILMVSRRETALHILSASATAGIVTAAIAALVGGGLGIYHIVALALVAGIGIDYGVFLSLSETLDEQRSAAHSVIICAITTLLAFVTMAFSGISILTDIGVTVSVGIITMLVVHFTLQERLGKDRVSGQ